MLQAAASITECLVLMRELPGARHELAETEVALPWHALDVTEEEVDAALLEHDIDINAIPSDLTRFVAFTLDRALIQRDSNACVISRPPLPGEFQSAGFHGEAYHVIVLQIGGRILGRYPTLSPFGADIITNCWLIVAQNLRLAPEVF